MDSINTIRPRRRGMYFLIIAIVMLIAGETVLRHTLDKVPFLIYWLTCFICTGLAILFSFLDVAGVQRRARQEQRELLDETIREIARQEKAKSASEDEREQK